MKKEQWEYITTNWGTQDPVIMEEIAKMKDADEAELRELETRVSDRDAKIQELTQQNVELNKTNMNLILRLTDPALSAAAEKLQEEEEYKAPDLNDLDAFVKEE